MEKPQSHPERGEWAFTILLDLHLEAGQVDINGCFFAG